MTIKHDPKSRLEKMKPAILSENIHTWSNTLGQILVSHEDTKTLRSFPTIDDAINGLWLTGHKTEARKLNAIKKETQA